MESGLTDYLETSTSSSFDSDNSRRVLASSVVQLIARFRLSVDLTSRAILMMRNMAKDGKGGDSLKHAPARRLRVISSQVRTRAEPCSIEHRDAVNIAAGEGVDEVITRLIDINKKHWGKIDPEKVDINCLNKPMPPIVRGSILAFFDQIENQLTSSDGYSVAEHLPGPMSDMGNGKTYSDVKEILAMMMKATNEGYNHMVWVDLQDKYCKGSRIANFVLPVISFQRNNARAPILTNHVILSDPDDCARIAKDHVKKMPDQGLFLHNGVLSQIDNDRYFVSRADMRDCISWVP